jgi:hypothetical protein
MLWFGQAMIDVALGAGVLEGVCPDRLFGVDRRLDIGTRMATERAAPSKSLYDLAPSVAALG